MNKQRFINEDGYIYYALIYTPIFFILFVGIGTLLRLVFFGYALEDAIARSVIGFLLIGLPIEMIMFHFQSKKKKK